MELQIIIAIIILATLVGAIGYYYGFRAVKECEVAIISDVDIELGKTNTADVYPVGGSAYVMGFVDFDQKRILVVKGDDDKVKPLFGVEEDSGESWVLNHQKAKDEFKLVYVEKGTINEIIQTTNLLAIKGNKCKLYKKNSCVNFYRNSDGMFVYSWKATEDTYLCTQKPGTCAETYQSNPVTLYPGKNCKGKSHEFTKSWKFCSPV